MRKLLFCAGALGAGVILVAGGAASAGATNTTLSVPGNHPTLQAAFDAAPRTGIVEVRIAAGTYVENVVATGFGNLSIVAEPGAVLRGTSASEPALSVCMSGSVNLMGLTIESQSVGLQVLGVSRFTSTNTRVAGTTGAAVVAENSLTSGIVLVGGHGERVSVQATNATFAGLQVADAPVGVLVRNNATVSVNGSRIEDVSQDGIRAESGTVSVVESAITAAGDDGVDSAGASVTVAHSNVSDVGDAGITVGTGRASVALTTISDAGRVGIETRGGAICDVTGCTVRDVGGDGIRVGADLVTSNVVTGVARDGISILPTDQTLVTGEIAWNRVAGARTGIVVAATDLAVTANVVQQTTGAGISIGGDRVTLASNVVEDAGGDGISVAGFNPVLIENRVDGAVGDGLDVVGEDAYVDGNVVESTAGAGVRVTGDGAVVQDNEANSTGSHGVVVGAGWSSVTGQVVEGAGGDGICLLGQPERAGALIGSNSVASCAGDGIDAGAAVQTRIERNAVQGAGACGIRLGDGARGNRLARNVVKGSGDADLWEEDGAGRNVVKRNNRFATRHRRSGR